MPTFFVVNGTEGLSPEYDTWLNLARWGLHRQSAQSQGIEVAECPP